VLRRRGQTVEQLAAAPRWAVQQGYYDDKMLVARFHTAFKEAKDCDEYPIQVGVAVPLNEADARGMPSSIEMQQLDRVEDTIVALASPHAVLVGVITTNSMREFVLYTRTSDWIATFDERLRSIETHRPQVMAQPDPSWNVYRQFVA
jgi:hypothetical protein